MAKLIDEVKTLGKLTEAEVAKIHTAIDAWFVKHFHGNRVAADTETFNLAHAAKEDLKTIVAPVATTPAPAAAADTTAAKTS